MSLKSTDLTGMLVPKFGDYGAAITLSSGLTPLLLTAGTINGFFTTVPLVVTTTVVSTMARLQTLTAPAYSRTDLQLVPAAPQQPSAPAIDYDGIDPALRARISAAITVFTAGLMITTTTSPVSTTVSYDLGSAIRMTAAASYSSGAFLIRQRARSLVGTPPPRV